MKADFYENHIAGLHSPDIFKGKLVVTCCCAISR